MEPIENLKNATYQAASIVEKLGLPARIETTRGTLLRTIEWGDEVDLDTGMVTLFIKKITYEIPLVFEE